MKGSVLGRRYADALLGLGIKSGQAEAYGRQLAAAADLLGVAETRKVLLSPLYDAALKTSLLDTAQRELQLALPVANLLRLMLDKRRLGLLGEVAAAYQELLDKHLGRVQATVVSAVPLDNASLARLRVMLQKKIGQRIQLSARTDPKILGGLRVEVGSKVYDITVANHLARLREQLKRVQ